MPKGYDPASWYWFVADAADPTKPYSSADAAYVALTDAGYVAFLADGNAPSDIAVEQDLWDYVNGRVYNGTPPTAYSTTAAKEARLAGQLAVSDALWRIAFDQENRIRTLEQIEDPGSPGPITEAEFFDTTVALMK